MLSVCPVLLLIVICYLFVCSAAASTAWCARNSSRDVSANKDTSAGTVWSNATKSVTSKCRPCAPTRKFITSICEYRRHPLAATSRTPTVRRVFITYYNCDGRGTLLVCTSHSVTVSVGQRHNFQCRCRLVFLSIFINFAYDKFLSITYRDISIFSIRPWKY